VLTSPSPDIIGGNLRSPSLLSDENILAAAETIYRHRKVLPLDVAVSLLERGFIVEDLERQWDATMTQSF
jgi:hypothetical protein